MTTTKTPKKKSLPKPTPETTDEAQVVTYELAPATYKPVPQPRDNDALAALLRAQAMFGNADWNRVDGHGSAVAFVAGLDDAQYAAVWTWARAITWLFDETLAGKARPAVRRAELIVPEAMATHVDPDIDSPDTIIDAYTGSAGNSLTREQIIDEAPVLSVVEEIIENTTDIVGAIVDEALAKPTPDATGQLPLVQEAAPPAKPIKPMAFRGPDEVVCVHRALQARMSDLEAEAKRLDTLGKPAAAKDCRDEARLIKGQLLPQVTAQTTLPFNENEPLPQLVARLGAREVRFRARAALLKSIKPNKGESHADAKARVEAKLDDFEALIGNVGEQVGALMTKVVVAAAERGIDMGKRAIAIEPSAAAREALQLVEADAHDAQRSEAA